MNDIAHIRPVYYEDAPQVHDLLMHSRAEALMNRVLGLDQSWADHAAVEFMENDDVSLTGLKIHSALRHNEKYLMAVAEQGGDINGYLFAERGKVAQEIHHLFVRNSHRNAGIGSRLMHLYDAWHDGALPTVLAVERHNSGAVQFYGRHGFTEEPRLLRDTTLPIMTMVRPPHRLRP